MALFGKKSSDSSGGASASGTTTTSKDKGGLFGRGKKNGDTPAANGAPVAPAQGTASDANLGFDDFGDFSSPSPGFSHAPVATTRARPKVVNGTAIGLNIGNSSIKAVELRAQGGSIKVVGAAMVHTPLESLSNGVIMSQGSLSHAIKSVIQAAGIKSRAATTAVAGTGSIVVRVVEMPRMSDKELEETMKTDAEKFIPFAPEEVRLDFRPLRELPSPPDSPNMDVLIAAAQREVLYQYGDVLKAAKLSPRAIEVEPLAVARTVSHAGGGDEVDYARVTAAINIGASATEISVLRGDVLVFTRTLPSGGNALTQALVDYLGLSESEAERVKQQFGDALPSFQNSVQPSAAPTQTSTGFDDDWANLDFDTPSGVADPTASEVPTSDFGASDVTSVTVVSPTSTSASPTASSDDPFDLDAFTQGTNAPGTSGTSGTNISLQKDAGEQHGQQQDSSKDNPEGNPKPDTAFDFSSFDFGDLSPDEPAKTDLTSSSTPSQSATPAAVTPTSNLSDASTGASAFNFDFDVPDATPSASQSTVSIDEPQAVDIAAPPVVGESTSTTISFAKPSDADDLGASTSSSSSVSPPASVDANAFDFSFDDAVGANDTPASSSASTASLSSTTASTAPLPDADADVPDIISATPASAAPASSAPSDSSFDFDFPQDTASASPAATTATTGAGDLDFDAGPVVSDASMSVIPADDASAWGLDDPTAGTATNAAPVSLGKTVDASAPDDFDLDAIFNAPAPGAVAGGAVAGGAVVGGVGTAGEDPFGTGGLDDFGAGLTSDIAPGVDAPTVYSILHPLLDELAGEIRRSLEYHASRYPEAVVQTIELVGGGAKLRNLDAFLTQSLGIPASVGDPMRNLGGDISPQARTDSPAYAVAVGLALRELLA